MLAFFKAFPNYIDDDDDDSVMVVIMRMMMLMMVGGKETLQPPFLRRPSLKMTALSYSWTTWKYEMWVVGSQYTHTQYSRNSSVLLIVWHLFSIFTCILYSTFIAGRMWTCWWKLKTFVIAISRMDIFAPNFALIILKTSFDRVNASNVFHVWIPNSCFRVMFSKCCRPGNMLFA